jgi:hypothetical protein
MTVIIAVASMLVLLNACGSTGSSSQNSSSNSSSSGSGSGSGSESGAAPQTAAVPQVGVPHTYPSQPSANQYSVTAGNASDLQTKINTAAANCGSTGAVVTVPAGNTYTATTYFNLPATNCDATHWVLIQSASLSSLPAQGTRISASTANMPTLSTSAFTTYPVIMAADNPSAPPKGYWLAGLDIEDDPPNTGANQLALVVLGDYCVEAGGGGCPITSGMTSANLASRFTIDRCWIHPTNPTSNILHGIRFSASNLAVEDSIIEAHYTTVGNTAQTTGISSDYSLGPVDIGNSEIMAVTENILFGGSDPIIAGSVPSDIYIHQNYIHKRPEWMDAGGANYFQSKMRNWIECKNCQRMLVEGNVFDTQAGNSVSAAFQFTPRNTGGSCRWCVTQDIVIRYNTISNLSDLISVLGANGSTSGGSLGPELPTKRISLHDNTVENLNDSTYGGNGRIFQVNDGDASSAGCSSTAFSNACNLSDIVFSHNTITDSGHIATFWTLAETPVTNSLGYNVVIANNIGPAGSYGFASDAGSTHPLTGFLNAQYLSYTFDGNAITGVPSSGYSCSDFPSPIQNFCGGIGQPATMSSLEFVNYNNGVGGDYHLCHGVGSPSSQCSAASPYTNAAIDKTDVGAAIDSVGKYTSGVAQGTPTFVATLSGS